MQVLLPEYSAWFSHPSPGSPPPTPAPPSNAQAQSDAANQANALDAQRRGMGSTVLTSPEGVLGYGDPSTVQRKTLLGS